MKISLTGKWNVSPEQRFWALINKRGKDECWERSGSAPDGYTAIKVGADKMTAHRYSWILHFGSIPKILGCDSRGTCVLHACDNRRCVNPAHLFLGTQFDNIKDMDAKNRRARGEKNGRPKLNNRQVRLIKRCKVLGVCQRFLGRIFGVSSPIICRIGSGVKWRHIEL